MKGTRIAMRHGTEGPRHDPYSFAEYIVKRGDFTIMLHEGLATYVCLTHPAEGTHTWDASSGTPENLVRLFTALAGMTIATFTRAYDRLRSRCPSCGNRQLHFREGFPGETLRVCDRCDMIVACYFCENAVV